MQAVISTPATEGSIFKTDVEAAAKASHRPRPLHIGHAYLDHSQRPEPEEVRDSQAAERLGPKPGARSSSRYYSLRVLDTIPSLLLHSYHTKILKQIK